MAAGVVFWERIEASVLKYLDISYLPTHKF